MTSDSQGHEIDLEPPVRLLNRLREHDATLWSDDPAVEASIRQRLGWLDAVDFSRRQLERIRDFANQVRLDGFDRVILLGMGGSSLAPEVFNQCFAGAENRLDMIILDTTFPDTIVRASRMSEHLRPLFIVSSKSGATAETSALFRYFRQWCRDRYGNDWGDHFVAITDEDSGLHRLAEEGGFREIFLNPADIGGRYSALSLFGLVPASLAGVDVARLLDRASTMLDDAGPAAAAVNLGILIGHGIKAGRDKLALAFSPRIRSLGLWIEQLVAESTGKQGVGVVPFFQEDPSLIPHFSDECTLVSSRLAGDSHPFPAAQILQTYSDNGHRPVIEISLDDAHDLGAEFMRWQIATAIAASVVRINPFDEPDVNATKKATNLILQNESRTAQIIPGTPSFDPNAIQSFLNRVETGDYIAILAFLPSDQNWEEALKPLRQLLQQHCGTVVCLALGPRYLHSSGQLHKGGRKNGHFLVLTATPGVDAPVPGEHYSFGTLIDAQARADIEVLCARGQNVLHINLGPVDRGEAILGEITTHVARRS
jgi:glucose-6-phosphate isomerase